MKILASGSTARISSLSSFSSQTENLVLSGLSGLKLKPPSRTSSLVGFGVKDASAFAMDAGWIGGSFSRASPTR